MENKETEQKPTVPKSIKQIRQSFIFLLIFGIFNICALLYFLITGSGPRQTVIIYMVIVAIISILSYLSFFYLKKFKKISYIIALISFVLYFTYELYFSQGISFLSIIAILGMLYLGYCLWVVRGYYLKTGLKLETFHFSPLFILILAIGLNFAIALFYSLYFVVESLIKK